MTWDKKNLTGDQAKWSKWHLQETAPETEPEKSKPNVKVFASAFVFALSAFVLSGGFHPPLV